MSGEIQVGSIPQTGANYPIGVIVPTYNRSEVLQSCLLHLEQQTVTDFEVIVVDDGSTDGTARLLKEYQQRSPLHLRCIRVNNGGPARARNIAISNLRSPVCLMIGDDIFASPNLVSEHLQLHLQRPGIQVAGLGLTRWSESGQTVTPFMRWLESGGVQFAYRDLLRGAKPDWKYFYTSNLSLKTQLMREHPFNEAFTKAASEDLELGFRLEQERNLEVVFLPDALAYHLHPTSFRQACNRMFNVGSSMRLFHELWPNSAPAGRNSFFRRSLRNFLVSNPWLLPPLSVVAEAVSTVWCPDLLMRGTLMFYSLLGYQTSMPSQPRKDCPPLEARSESTSVRK